MTVYPIDALALACATLSPSRAEHPLSHVEQVARLSHGARGLAAGGSSCPGGDRLCTDLAARRRAGRLKDLAARQHASGSHGPAVTRSHGLAAGGNCTELGRPQGSGRLATAGVTADLMARQWPDV